MPHADAVDIRDHGASPSASASENAKAVNAAIRAAASGSGAVKVSAGRYYTGTVEMQSGVTLYLEEGAELSLPRYEERKAAGLEAALIKAENAHGWGIIGPGTLNGQGTGYPEITRVSHRYFISHALSSYYDLPVYGIYVRDVENFVLENFSVTSRQGNTRALTNFSA